MRAYFYLSVVDYIRDTFSSAAKTSDNATSTLETDVTLNKSDNLQASTLSKVNGVLDSSDEQTHVNGDKGMDNSKPTDLSMLPASKSSSSSSVDPADISVSTTDSKSTQFHSAVSSPSQLSANSEPDDPSAKKSVSGSNLSSNNSSPDKTSAALSHNSPSDTADKVATSPRKTLPKTLVSDLNPVNSSAVKSADSYTVTATSLLTLCKVS